MLPPTFIIVVYSYFLKAEFAKLIASHEELEKAHQNANSDLEDTFEDLQVKKRTIEELVKKNDELEALKKMLTVNHKNLERKVMKVTTDNKDLKTEVTTVKSELREASKDLKMSIKDQTGREHNLNKKIEQLEWKVKNLSEDKAVRAAEEKSIKKKVKALEKKQSLKFEKQKSRGRIS
jgi:chromosome segregation ATPase